MRTLLSVNIEASVGSSPEQHGLLSFALLLLGGLAMVALGPFVLIIFWALGSEEAFITSSQWHVLVLVVAGVTVVLLVVAVLQDVQGVKSVVRRPVAVLLVVGWLLLLAAVTGAVYSFGGDSPASTSPPLVLGAPAVGNTLRANPGQWNTALAKDDPFNYAWHRCVNGVCDVVKRYAPAKYVLSDKDVGGRMRVCVIALTFWWASSEVCSAQTSVVWR